MENSPCPYSYIVIHIREAFPQCTFQINRLPLFSFTFDSGISQTPDKLPPQQNNFQSSFVVVVDASNQQAVSYSEFVEQNNKKSNKSPMSSVPLASDLPPLQIIISKCLPSSTLSLELSLSLQHLTHSFCGYNNDMDCRFLQSRQVVRHQLIRSD